MRIRNSLKWAHRPVMGNFRRRLAWHDRYWMSVTSTLQ